MTFNIAPVSFQMLEDYDQNESNLKRYFEKTYTIAREEYFKTSRNIFLSSACCFFATAICCRTITLPCGPWVSIGCSFATYLSGTLSTPLICMHRRDDFSEDRFLKIRYLSKDTLNLSKKSFLNELNEKLLTFDVTIDELNIYSKYGILTEETAENYKILIQKREKLKLKLEETETKLSKHSNNLPFNCVYSSTQIEFFINKIPLTEKDRLLREPAFKKHLQVTQNLENQKVKVLNEIKSWDCDKENFLINLKKELPIFSEDSDFDFSCYSLFCKNLPK